MKNMRLCLIALMSITALLLASCAAVPGSTTIPTSTGSVSVGGEDLMAAVKAAPNQGAIQVPEPDFLTGISRFSATLLLESGKNKGNVMVSPLSVFLALAMTVNGADSDTRDDMLKVLTDGALTVDQVNEVSRNLIGLLEKSEPKTQVSIANSIWFRQGFKPFQPFLQANADYYGAGARSLDFSSDSATEAINGWVEQETMGLIEKIVSRISPTTVTSTPLRIDALRERNWTIIKPPKPAIARPASASMLKTTLIMLCNSCSHLLSRGWYGLIVARRLDGRGASEGLVGQRRTR